MCWQSEKEGEGEGRVESDSAEGDMGRYIRRRQRMAIFLRALFYNPGNDEQKNTNKTESEKDKKEN